MSGKLSISLAALLLLSGCSSLSEREAPESTTFSPDIPVTRMELPETPGKGRLQGLAYHGMNNRMLVFDAKNGPEEQRVKQDGEDEEPVIGGSYGLHDRVSAGLRLRTDLRHVALKSRIQLLGRPAHASGKGDLSLAVGLGYGWTRHAWDDSGDDDCLLYFICLEPEGDTLEGRYALDIKEASLILGYRPLAKLLVFGGGFYQDVDYFSRVTYIDPDDPADRVSNSDIDGAWQRGGNVGLGYALGERLMLIMEYVRYDLRWDDKAGVNDAEAFTGGLHVQF